MSLLAGFLENAERHPDRRALVVPDPGGQADEVSFAELRERAERYAGGLRASGFETGDSVLLACPLTVDFYALALALLGSGMVIVLVDGSMDRRRLLTALRLARAKGIVSTGAALRRWPLVPPLMGMRRYAIDRPPVGVRALDELRGSPGADLGAEHAADAPAILSFTSGSTGRAKGVVRTNGILLAQHRALATHHPYQPGDVDMPPFPAVTLHNLICGVTTVIPPGDLRNPGSIDPAPVADAIRRYGVTTLSGAPAYMGRLVAHVRGEGADVANIRHVAVGGAPVPRSFCAAVVEAFPRADAYVAYGATEAEPIAHIDMREVLRSSGEGLLVGAPVPELELELLRLPARVESELEPDELTAHAAGVGEIVVSGAAVSREYVGDPVANATNKVRTTDGAVWHRTGDIARIDSDGRIRLLGRRGQLVTHRGRELYPLPLEETLGELPGVGGAALVAHREAPDGEVAVVADQLTGIARVRWHLATNGLGELPVRRVESIPMDRRHNSKVDRPLLTQLLAGDGRDGFRRLLPGRLSQPARERKAS